MPIAVVKLGGSLANAGTLGGWLDAVLAHGRGRTVVVPGGGAFADAVRSAQVRLGFSDRAAARMAVLAMEQYAELLLDRAPSLRACSDAAAIRAALAASDVALWRPSRMVESDPAIAASWDVTSDSLAAWLARRVEAHRLVLVNRLTCRRHLSPRPSWRRSGSSTRSFPPMPKPRAVRSSAAGPASMAASPGPSDWVSIAP